MGATAELRRDYARAREYYARALAIAEHMGVRQLQLGPLGNLGNVEAAEGNYEAARAIYASALRMARDIGHAYIESHFGLAIAWAAYSLDLGEEALQQAEAALQILEKLGARARQVEPLAYLLLLAVDNGETKKAQTIADRISEIAPDSFDSWVTRAYAAACLGKPGEALAHARAALEAIGPSDQTDLLAMTMLAIAAGGTASQVLAGFVLGNSDRSGWVVPPPLRRRLDATLAGAAVADAGGSQYEAAQRALQSLQTIADVSS